MTKSEVNALLEGEAVPATPLEQYLVARIGELRAELQAAGKRFQAAQDAAAAGRSKIQQLSGALAVLVEDLKRQPSLGDGPEGAAQLEALEQAREAMLADAANLKAAARLNGASAAQEGKG